MVNKSKLFKLFLDNLKIDIVEDISRRYGEIGRSLNQEFRDSNSKTDNTLQVGSYGRRTAIKGISDLDMLYIMPTYKFDNYNSGKQDQLLRDVKEAISSRYPTTDVKVDRNVVVINFTNFKIEVVPVFEKDDGYLFPDTYNGVSWNSTLTKPKQELEAFKILNETSNNHLRNLCKIIRSWKYKNDVKISGMLIDTICFNFIKSYENETIIFSDYDDLLINFFSNLIQLENNSYFLAPGSNQKVYIKESYNFQKKAKKSLKSYKEAIDSSDKKYIELLRKEIFGNSFPLKEEENFINYDNTEEFIENKYDINIIETMDLNCLVEQKGFRPCFLSDLVDRKIPLKIEKKLTFQAVNLSTNDFDEIKWKVLNRGDIAKIKNNIRGQIIDGTTSSTRVEYSQFKGEHKVDCYMIKNNTVISKASILVPIEPLEDTRE